MPLHSKTCRKLSSETGLTKQSNGRQTTDRGLEGIDKVERIEGSSNLIHHHVLHGADRSPIVNARAGGGSLVNKMESLGIIQRSR